MFKPLEPVFALLVRERHHREGFEVEFPPIEDHKTPTHFKVPRLKIRGSSSTKLSRSQDDDDWWHYDDAVDE